MITNSDKLQFQIFTAKFHLSMAEHYGKGGLEVMERLHFEAAQNAKEKADAISLLIIIEDDGIAERI